MSRVYIKLLERRLIRQDERRFILMFAMKPIRFASMHEKRKSVAEVYCFWYSIAMKNYDMIYEYAADNYGLITSCEAKAIGISNVELVKLAHRGRLRRLGHGVYRIVQYIPTPYDKFAEAVALVGSGAVVYGESVLAMHGLALVNPAVIYIAIKNRSRKKLPTYIEIIYPRVALNETEYEGVPSQSVFKAILVCRSTVMTDRLIEAVSEAERQGLISAMEVKTARTELL